MKFNCHIVFYSFKTIGHIIVLQFGVNFSFFLFVSNIFFFNYFLFTICNLTIDSNVQSKIRINNGNALGFRHGLYRTMTQNKHQEVHLSAIHFLNFKYCWSLLSYVSSYQLHHAKWAALDWSHAKRFVWRE